MTILPTTTLPATLVALALSLFATGCGRAPVTAAPARAGAPVAAATRTTVDALAAHDTDAAYEGKRVALTATFERATWSMDYGRTLKGYRLLDGEAASLLCGNVFAASEAGVDDLSRDFAAAPAARLLARGPAVKVEGTFHVARTRASHSGVVRLPATLDVTAIDGVALKALLHG